MPKIISGHCFFLLFPFFYSPRLPYRGAQHYPENICTILWLLYGTWSEITTISHRGGCYGSTGASDKVRAEISRNTCMTPQQPNTIQFLRLKSSVMLVARVWRKTQPVIVRHHPIHIEKFVESYTIVLACITN